MKPKDLLNFGLQKELNEQSFVIQLKGCPSDNDRTLIMTLFGLSQKHTYGIDEEFLIDYVRRNMLGFSTRDLIAQTTQLVIRYLLNPDEFLMAHCAHCWAYLTKGNGSYTMCYACRMDPCWSEILKVPSYVCDHCGKEESDSHLNKRIRTK